MTMFQCPSDILIVYSSMKNATGEMLQHCDERGWPKQGEEHVAKVLSKCGYPTWTIDRVKQDIVEKSLKDEANKAKNTRGNHKGMIVVPYVKGLSEAFARILISHSITTANRPHRTLRNFVVYPKDKVKDKEKTELIYCVSCRTVPLICWTDKQEVWYEDQGTQERSGLFHSWYTDPSLQGKGEQCNSQVSHHRSCRGREPCHRLGQGKSGRQRGTATDQMDKRGRHFGSGRHRRGWIGMQDPTNSATHGTRWFPGHMLYWAVNNQDVIKMSDRHRKVVIR